MDLEELIIYHRTAERREAEYADYPSKMAPELKAFLALDGIKQLYSHQAEMFDTVRNGYNVVITTSTASGKTLSFLLPVIQEILENPVARAIFIYPTKALAADQYRALKPYLDYFGESRISAGVYDGDTPMEERSRIRRQANIILTNPEMLNGAFLPNHSRYGFDFIFSNLKYVVIDELHTYRGIFGSHVANVCRRLGRICSYYGSDPQFLCSSATIANPAQLAADVCGREFVRISRDGSPAAQREYYLVQPPKIQDAKGDFLSQTQALTVAADMIPDIVENGHNFIAFTRSRRNVEVLLREARDKLDSAGFLGHSMADKIAGYRGGYTPNQRKKIESQMIRGDLKGLVSTNALELGIDIGSVDTTILAGFPGTRASFWQQTGRAGRSGNISRNYLVLESLPMDQYIGINPGWLFDESSENAVVDKNNLFIELAHIRAAAAELPLTLEDIAVFPDLGEAIPVLMRVGELASRQGKFEWSGSAYPAGDFSLRNIDQKRYKLMDQEKHVQVTEMDELQAFREIHEGAIYMHEGAQYQVLRLDLESRTAFAIPFQGDYYTMPGGETEVKIIHEQEQTPIGRTRLAWGDVNVDDIVFMYKKLQFHNHQNLGYEMLEKPLSKDYDTESCWIRIPENVVQVYRSLLQEDARGALTKNNHFDGLCHALLHAAMMVTMTEKEDIGVSMSSNAIGMADTQDGGEVDLFLYDRFTGGLGYAQKCYEHMPDILAAAKKLVGGCSCENGCPACVGDYKLDRKVVLWGLENLEHETQAPQDYKYAKYAQRPVRKRPFAFGELPEKWEDFCLYVIKAGENMGAFLKTVPYVTLQDGQLTLYTTNDFYRQWIMEPENLKRIRNIFHYYTEGSMGARIRVMLDPETALDEGENRKLKEKLKKRYQNLTGAEDEE